MAVIPEVRTLVGRAAARRHVLEGLIASVPGDYWDRQASGDAWSALDHLRHVATVDALIVELLEAAGRADGDGLWLGGTREAAALEARRAALAEAVRGEAVGGLVAAMRDSREEALAALLALPAAALDREVRIAGAATAWGEPRTFALRAYLALWAEHDGEHEAAIRRAIETPPGAAALTLAARGRHSGRRR